MNILHVCANPKPRDESVSKQLAEAFFLKLADTAAEFDVSQVDLYENPPPYYSYEQYRGTWNPILIQGYQATSEELAAMEYATTQGELFRKADVLVLTLPMWRFGVPAILKSWLEHVLSPGIAYDWDAHGPKPLHHIRKIVLLAASGDSFKEDDPRDALTRQIEAAFGFIGIDDIGIAWAEAQDSSRFSNSAEHKNLAIEAAQELAEEVAELAAPATV